MEKFENEKDPTNEITLKIIEKVFGVTPDSIEEIKGKGKNNLVYKVVVNNEPVILRLSDKNKTLDLYEKEKWCSDSASEAGVLTPKILEVGLMDGYSFSFQEYVDGVSGKELGEDLGEIWFDLGQSAKLINQIPAPNIRVDYEQVVDELFKDDFFVENKIFSEKLSLKIKNRLKETIKWKFSPSLCHGNIHPTNAIVDKDGKTHIIDWETATGNIVPQSELAEIYTWNNGKENIDHFLRGYGLEGDEVKHMMRDIQTLVLLRLLQVIVRKVEKSKKWRDDSYIKEMSVLLVGIRDYDKDILFTKNL